MDGTVRYLGGTSGATFVDRLKDFMCTLVQCVSGGEESDVLSTVGQYQTFDSRPLSNPDVDHLWLPSRTDMSAMLVELRYYIQDGNGDFPCGGIYWWGDLNVIPSPVTRSTSSVNAVTTDESYRYLAFHHVCFALASSIGHKSYRHSEQHTGEAYFKRARVLLGNPLDFVRSTLDDVPVLTLMAFYLIEINRRDAAYIYLGIAVRIALIHGTFEYCATEAFKRIMWTVYILDRWLSVLMGRPPTIAEEAIRLALPVHVPELPSCEGLLAHIELSRISNHIVCETYRIASRNCKPGGSADDIDIALDMLQGWQSNLPSSLQMPEDAERFDPACCILHMAHNQLVVLTTRPLFFATVKRIVAQLSIHGDHLAEEPRQIAHMLTCSNAAHRNLLLAQRLVASSIRPLQAGLHFIFNGAVILLLRRLVRYTLNIDFDNSDARSTSSTATEEDHEPGIQFAVKTFEEEAKTGTNYSRDCSKILQDLDKLTNHYAASLENLVQQRGSSLEQVYPYLHATNGQSDYAASPHTPLHLLGEGDAGHAEVLTWFQNNGLRLQETLFI
ncbi:hypothetical protein ACEQ8H_002661 [Pleosporales sp. CAS-2024a]